MGGKTFNFEDRLVQFAGECISFCRTLPNDSAGRYYADQMLRSSGSSALNYGEAQGTITDKDFIHKMSLVLEELRETKVTLKILGFAKIGTETKRA
ncbi:MAG: four helix bundle protein [Bacteroidota bacterium]